MILFTQMNSLPKQLLVGASRTLDNYDHTPINLAAAEVCSITLLSTLSGTSPAIPVQKFLTYCSLRRDMQKW